VWPHDLKLGRAQHHLKELTAAIERWLATDVEIVVDPDPSTSRHASLYVVKARILNHIDDDHFALLLGDFLQNARAALDYLAFALGEQGAGGVMPDAAAAGSGFPIIGNADAKGRLGRGADLFAKAAARKLATVAEPARIAIEHLQPYYVAGAAWKMEPLWILHELARFDRHRLLQLTVVQTGLLRLDPANRNARIIEMEPEWGRFWDDEEDRDGTVLARVTAEPIDPAQAMHLHFLDALHIGLHPDTIPASLEHALGSSPGPIDLELGTIERHVRQAIVDLRPYLPAAPPSYPY
jgi:hypothetical protein